MEILAPLSVVLIGFALIMLVGSRNRWLVAPLVIGFIARLLTGLMHSFVFPLPQGGSDAKVFNALAFTWSADGWLAFFNHVDFSSAYVYSALLASFYACIGYSTLAAQFLNAIAGTLAIAALSISTSIFWGRKPAQKIGYLLAIYPTLLIYSAVTLRESFIFFFLSMAIYGIVRQSQTRRLGWAVFAVSMMVCAAAFHGAMICTVGVYLFVLAGQRLFALGNSQRAKTARALYLVLGLALFPLFVIPTFDHVYIPKVGVVGELDATTLNSVIENRDQGNAAYLQGLRLSSPVDIVWQAPLRTAYLLFAPFPWNVTSAVHVFGFLDGMFNLFVAVRLFKFRKEIRSHPAFWPILGVLGALALVFGFGTSNFGTGLRHRSKFYLALLVLVGPYLFPVDKKASRRSMRK